MAATRTTTRHPLNRTHELANVKPQTALQTPKNLLAPALPTPSRGHAENLNPLENLTDAPANGRNGEGIHVAVNHVTMTEVLDVPTHVIMTDATVMVAETTSVMIETTAAAEDAQAIALDEMVSPTYVQLIDAMNNVPKRLGVIGT